MNYVKTAMLLTFLTGILVAMGAAAGGQTGMVIAFVVALAMNFFSFWQSDTMVLKMFRGQEVNEQTAPDYYRMVKDLAARADLPMPRVYILPQEQPNAFATGRSPERSAVACSEGLMRVLNRDELAGVIAHELAHIKNRDTLTMTIAATIGGAISMLAQWMQFSMMFGGNGNRSGPLGWVGMLAVALLAPFAAMLVQMAISRSREYQADEMGAQICGNPIWLASALDKIAGPSARQVVNETAENIPAAAHLFIVNPLTGRGVDNLFSTHPNTENRIAALGELAKKWGMTSTQSSMPGRPAPPQTATPHGHGDAQPGPWSTPTNKPKRKRFTGPWSRRS
ncbi:MAG: zinc metalloprotease HtpX [Pseudomonadota bacterium]